MPYRLSDINRDDHRAWYGLGQAYELLNMHDYALYYLQHATALKYASFRKLIPLNPLSQFLRRAHVASRSTML